MTNNNEEILKEFKFCFRHVSPLCHPWNSLSPLLHLGRQQDTRWARYQTSQFSGQIKSPKRDARSSTGGQADIIYEGNFGRPGLIKLFLFLSISNRWARKAPHPPPYPVSLRMDRSFKRAWLPNICFQSWQWWEGLVGNHINQTRSQKTWHFLDHCYKRWEMAVCPNLCVS